MSYKRVLFATMLGLGTIMSGAALAEDKPVRIAMGYTKGTIIGNTMQAFADAIAGESGLKPEIFPMTLLTLPETAAGIRDGIADIGYVLTSYSAAEFSEANLAGDMTMLVTVGEKPKAPGVAMAGAFIEYVLLNCPECLDQFKAQNQVYIGGGAGSDLALICAKPVASLADLKGKKFRTGGANVGRWVEHFGGTKVSLPAGEMFEAMSQGAVDCVIIASPDVIQWQLTDVAKQVMYGIPGGAFAAVGSTNTNIEFWKGLTTEQRAAIIKGASVASAGVAVGYLNAADDASKQAREKGLKFEPAPKEMAEASDAFVQGDMKVVAEQFTTAYGLKNVDAKMTTIIGLIDKWKAKVATIDATNLETVTKLYWDEVYSKLDPATYAMQ
ncbi:MAG: hypothetical protein KF694_22165 [Mesorhizobium sp.]|nr:hypothetical protein [Mesorhizobium sp.]